MIISLCGPRKGLKISVPRNTTKVCLDEGIVYIQAGKERMCCPLDDCLIDEDPNEEDTNV